MKTKELKIFLCHFTSFAYWSKFMFEKAFVILITIDIKVLCLFCFVLFPSIFEEKLSFHFFHYFSWKWLVTKCLNYSFMVILFEYSISMCLVFKLYTNLEVLLERDRQTDRQTDRQSFFAEFWTSYLKLRVML